MKKNYTFLTILFFSILSFATPIFGQIKYSIGFNVDFLKTVNINGTKTTIDTRYDFFSYDSTLTTFQDSRDINLTTTYSQAGKGLKLYGLAHIPIHSKINLVTGIGVDASIYYANTIFTKVDLTTKYIGTTKLDTLTSSSYLNANISPYGLHAPWDRNNEITVANLFIPIEIDYELFKNLRVFGGGKIKTPIFARYNSYKRIVRYHEGRYSSTTYIVKNKSTRLFHRLSAVGFGGLKYRILDKYEISVSASKSFTNILRPQNTKRGEKTYQNVEFLPFKPFNYSIGVHYFLGR